MFKKIAKRLIATAVAATMAVSLAVVTMPQTARATMGRQDYVPRELERDGWTMGAQDDRAWSKEVNYTLRSISDAGRRVAIYSGLPLFDWSDNVYWNGMNTYNSIIDSVDIVNGTVYANVSSSLSYMTNQTDRILITSSEGIYVGSGNDEYVFPSSFTLGINISVYDEGNTPDPKSLSEGWQTTDQGRTYTMSYDPYQVGEGMQGTSLPTAIPSLSTYGYFTPSDMLMDINASRFIKSAVMNGNNYLNITFVDNLTPYAQAGTSGTISFSKSIINDTGAQATYTLTIPLRVTNLANARVNGMVGPATVTVTKGDNLRVDNIDTANQPVVHWTTDSSGYVDRNDMSSLPRISSNGTIDTSSLKAGTYYFYIRVGGNLETRTFTLVVKNKETANQIVYRLTNLISNEALYTTDKNEVNTLVGTGNWRQDPSPGKAGGDLPIYRIYNPASGEHMYTSDVNEINVLVSKYGWQRDNFGKALFLAFRSGTYGMYRLYNPLQPPATAHFYTTNATEYNSMISSGQWTVDNAGKPMFYLN